MHITKNIYNSKNILLAWQRLKSNPDHVYKSYFREIYSAFSIAGQDNIRTIISKLKNEAYEPTKACKIYFPKSSGILRPYTLLTIEDQIVYQSMVNIIADKLFEKIKGNYYKKVFGHIYAGKDNNWLYDRWQKGHHKFNEKAKSAHLEGYKYAATFDLTACYDSIDHNVLKYFLKKLRLSDEFCESFIKALSIWTATNENIFHGHGIPQGPLSSGIVSEVVLKHFDDTGIKDLTSSVKYFRYVDDIHLYAKDEEHLRIALVALDKRSKDIGLFPQSSKVDIRLIENIGDEITTISTPDIDIYDNLPESKSKIDSAILDVTPRYAVSDKTKFKLLLSKATPSHKLTSRLLKIVRKSPVLYEPFSRYLMKYNNIPLATANNLIDIIQSKQPYQTISANLLRAIKNRTGDKHLIKIRELKALWKNPIQQEDLRGSLCRLLISKGLLTDKQIKAELAKRNYWWSKCQIFLEVSLEYHTESLIKHIIYLGIRSHDNDVAMCAALLLGRNDIKINLGKQREINDYAKNILKSFGLINRSHISSCAVNIAIEKFLDEKPPKINWKKFLKIEYKNARRHITQMQGYFSTDASAWVNSLDVFNDYLLHGLYKSDPSLGTYTLGKDKIGSITGSQPKALRNKYPNFLHYITNVHNERYASRLSHTRISSSSKPTRRIKFSYIKHSLKLLKLALSELSAIN